MDKSEDLQSPSEFALLTMLLRLTSTLRNGNGDISMREFEEVSKESHVSTIKSNAQSSDTKDFMSLDAVGELLVRDREIISTCYTTNQRIHFTAVTQTQPSDLDLYIEGISESLEVRSLEVAAIANSTLSDETGLEVLDKGRDRWVEISEKEEWQCLTWNREDYDSLNLQDHAATTFSYLNSYLHAGSKDRTRYKAIFYNYVLCACWRKMYRRISGWSALAFIQSWFIYEPFFKARIESHDFLHDPELIRRGPGDKTLAKHLLGNVTALEKLASKLKLPDFQPLINRAKSGAGPIEGEGALYTKETALSFHQLVYGTLIWYGSSLRRVKVVWEGDYANLASMKSAFMDLKILSRQLTYILCSSAFKQHIKVITMKGSGVITLLPKYDQREACLKFGSEKKIRDSKDRLSGKSQTEDRTEAHAGPVSSLNEVEQSLRVEGLVKWVRTFTAQIIAKRTLEIECESLAKALKQSENEALIDPDAKRPRVQISLFSVSSSRYKNPSFSEIETAIKCALLQRDESTNENVVPSEGVQPLVDRVIAIICQKLDAHPKWDGEAGRIRGMFKALLSNGKNHTAAPPTIFVHAEAVLALLAKYPDNSRTPSTNQAIRNICVESQTALISVSKLCCPVCWSLLEILRSETGGERFNVRGCHTVMYPIDLPTWTDPRIRQKMVERFRGYLKSHLLEFINEGTQPASNFQPSHRSQLSETNISVASTTEEGELTIDPLPANFGENL